MERMTGRRLVAVQILLALLALLALASCPNPLLEEIKDRVSIYQHIDKPDIVVKQGDVEIGEGEAYVYINADVLVHEDVVFTIWNEGKVNLVFQDPAVVIAGDEASMFTMPLPFSATAVAPGGSCTLTVRFLPAGSGTMGAVVNIYSDDPDESPYDFRVRGTVGPEIDLAQGGELFESGSYTHVFPGTFCDAQSEAAFSVSNPGTAILALGEVSLIGEGASQFTVVSQPAASLAPRQSTSFTLRFQPNTPGTYSATVSLPSDDPDESPYTFTVTGGSTLDFRRVKLAAGTVHSVALKNNGTVWTWGFNQFGQLGDGSTVQRAFPAQVSSLTNIVSVAVGQNHTLALKDDGTVWAWGLNNDLQLGNESTADEYAPVQVHNLSGVVAIAAGLTHSLALKGDGTVWAWGANSYGNLGIGNNSSQTTVVQVSGLSGITAIAANGHFSLARKGDGTAWAWGRNDFGQLGNATDVDSADPIQVHALSQVTDIAAGLDHAVARLANGEVRAWGNNVKGQLGDGTTTDRWTPVPVPNLTEVESVTAGGWFTAVKKNNGQIWCFGFNDYGQLGDGSTTRSSEPVQVSGLSGADQISAGMRHVLACKTDGTVWAWGYGWYEKLGDGTMKNRLVPVQVGWFGGTSALACGQDFTIALRYDGTVWGWGNNVNGLLGDGTTAAKRLTPVQAANLSGVVAITAGCSHSAALKSDGTVWTWGTNSYGQLGHAAYPCSLVPAEVTAPVLFSSIAAGFGHTVAVATDGTVWAWGWNAEGQLGDGTITSRSSPVQVQGLAGVSKVSAGHYHSLALKGDGTVWAWGQNTSGQLGVGVDEPVVTQSLTPMQVEGLTAVTAIASGWWHNLAIRSDTSLWAWGGNSHGQIGNGSLLACFSPVQTSLFNITGIAAGPYHSLACANYQWTHSWGYNNCGQLGDGTTVDKSSPIGFLGTPEPGSMALAAGYEHSVRSTADTWVWSSGRNDYGQLGDATSDDRLEWVHAGFMPFLLN